MLDFVTPSVVALVAALGSTAASIATRPGKPSKPTDFAAMEAERKQRLESAQQDRLRRRRSAGSGQQNTILGGAPSQQADIGRNVLLGQ